MTTKESDWYARQTEMMAAMLEMLAPALHEVINKEEFCEKGFDNQFMLMVVSPAGDDTAVFSYASSAQPEQAFPAMREFLASFEERIRKSKN
jgi:hypothetical protein